MNEESLINYIKSKYQKIIFNPVKLGENSLGKHKTLGFVISDEKLIIGYINNDGNLCKLMEPIDLNDFSNDKFLDIINKLPIIKDFDNSILKKIFNSENTLVKDEKLKDILDESKVKYDVLMGDNEKNILLIKKEYTSKIDDIKIEYDSEIAKLKENLESCKTKLLNEKNVIIDGIKNYKNQVSEYINNIVKEGPTDTGELNDMYLKLLKEKEDIENTMKKLIENEGVLEDENGKLKETIKDIQDELNKVEDQFNEKELEMKFKENCINQMLNQKEMIINTIKEHNSKWIDWINNNNVDIESQKAILSSELDVIFSNLQKVINSKNEYIDKMNISSKEKDFLINKLNNNTSDIKHEVNKTLSEQLSLLSIKNEELSKKYVEEVKSKDDIIDDLTRKLEDVKALLAKNASIKMSKDIDYDSCYVTLHKFTNVNNMFYRKKQIIAILEEIFHDSNNMTSFNNLNDKMKTIIINKFEKVKNEINKHIDFLDLNKYISSPNIKLFKSKSTIKSVPGEFCEELNNISRYWDNNIELFREQDDILTNIYEDLSGAVRVYIKIKPPPSKNIEIENKKISIDCGGKKETFGKFYDIFSGTNKDVYLGKHASDTGDQDIYNLKASVDESLETVNNGLYSSFKQVEDGYSIVLFGYGDSGSGKTYSLLGEKNVPGLLHYGLSNLNGVKNIKLKYLFEQYIDKFVPTINKIRGKIINLIREVPQMRKYSIDETRDFAEFISESNINVNNLHINDINTLTSLLEQYRKNHKRIKNTPNNPVSSRSHLYMVYEVSFENKIGYITIVDTAGRESPIELYNMYIENVNARNLTTILGPTGGPEIVEKYLKKEHEGVDSNDVYNILKEGFYINETINHLVYYFNKKNYKTTKVVSQTNLDKYNDDKFYVNPKNEETSIDPANNCLTIPILKFLDIISNRKVKDDEYYPTKFIMLVCLNSSCGQMLNSLKFAENIKSS